VYVLRDLVHIAEVQWRGQPAPDVQELAHTVFAGQHVHRARQEPPALR
jgi:hypothetical protein